MNLYEIKDLDKLLFHFQINPDYWIKSVSSLYDEVKNGDCILVIEEGRLRSLVTGVVIKCFHTNSQGERYQLVEDKQVFKDGQTRKRGHKFVAEKLRSGESPEQGALRGLVEELQISGPDVHVIPLFEENKCDIVDSPDYKGIQTCYNTYVFSCEILDSYYKNSYVEVQADKQTYFSWAKI
ncbi:MAG: NUDIX hydrolase [Parachlamydiaceae bacterium]|nr:NUDIX hydrolase [Parachlamydiaceae bacterium]